MSTLKYLNPIYLCKGTYSRIRKVYGQALFRIKSRAGKIKCATIVNAQTRGTKIHVFKEETIEKVPINKVFGFIVDGSFSVNYPEIDLWKFENATVIEGADYVFLENYQVFWKKYFAYNYSKNVPLDSLFIKEEDGVLFYQKPKKTQHVGVAFSLLGVHNQIWSHSLSEYYPKIFELKYALDDCGARISVLVPNYSDKQLKEIVYDELSKYNNIEIIQVEKETAVEADILYYMERPTTFTDHENSVSLGDDVQPKRVADILKEKLVAPRLKGIDKNEHIKLFLPRRGFGRNIKNYAEVEDYFRKQGFVFMDYPHRMTLEEKIRMFHSADVIVGPFGSAFSNIIFCRPKTKMLLFSNYNRHFEAWLCMHQMYFDIDALWVTGYDDKTAYNKSHSSYYIPLDKIVAAAKFHGIIDE